MNTQSKTIEDLDEIIIDESVLVLWNDDVNTFDHVIECLVKYCNHSSIQAEQCAFIVHHNGKCVVKKGELNKLSTIAKSLSNKGLTVELK